MQNEETVFVAKTVKIKNNKSRDYFLYRMTIPKEIVEKMDLQSNDHLLIKAKKASWYHLLDWSQMGKSWDMLSDEAKKEVISLGLPKPAGVVASPFFNYATESRVGVYASSASSYIPDKASTQMSPLLSA
jgi:hypothetical protein